MLLAVMAQCNVHGALPPRSPLTDGPPHKRDLPHHVLPAPPDEGQAVWPAAGRGLDGRATSAAAEGQGALLGRVELDAFDRPQIVPRRIHVHHGAVDELIGIEGEAGPRGAARAAHR
jgi:hypothetical protein